MSYTIEKSIPLASTMKGGTDKTRRNAMIEAMKKMEVGDSILVAGTDVPRISVTTACSSFKLYADLTFASRTVDGGYRVWRVE